jgi:ribosome-binding factor A
MIQRKIGQMVLHDLSDPRIDTARTSITRVEVQEDLLRAKVYVSVIGTDADQRRTLDALKHAAGHIRTEVAHEIDLRSMPALDFLTDERFKGALKTWEILRKVADEFKPAEPTGNPAESQPSEQADSEPEEDDSDKSDEDEQDQAGENSQ